MDWVESQINDENRFPVKVGELSPLNYQHLNISYCWWTGWSHKSMIKVSFLSKLVSYLPLIYLV